MFLSSRQLRHGSALALLLLAMLGAASAQPREGGPALTALSSVDSPPARPGRFALRMDNYIDVVDSILNARLRTRALRRVSQRPRLPSDPLLVRTTAAFTGKGAPAGAATWPPPSGKLLISAADGSRIELDADTGDIASVTVRVSEGSEVFVFREAWSIWAPLVLGDW